MSNDLAIATVTATLRDLLSTAIGASDIGGVAVTTRRPDSSMTGDGLNVFLYHVTSNAALQNADLPTRRHGGEVIQRPCIAIDLHYLLTFHGEEVQLLPQRVLGVVMRTLHARPVLTRDMIRNTIAGSAFLTDSNLADAVELVKFTLLPLSLEDLSKLWSVYFQTPYSLSVAYQATVVLIESEESARAALPVRSRNLYVVPFRRAVIEAVRPAGDGVAVITPESNVVVSGKRLRGDVTQVHIGDLPPVTTFTHLSDTEIRFALPAGLRAGVHGLQVVHPMKMGTPPVDHRGSESNLAPFILHPLIRKKTDGTPDIAIADGDMTVGITPPVSSAQRAALLMNELNPPPARDARAYNFDAAARTEAESDSLTFPISGVFPADHLVRVQVDGADSPLELDPASAEPRYGGPKVTIS